MDGGSGHGISASVRPPDGNGGAARESPDRVTVAIPLEITVQLGKSPAPGASVTGPAAGGAGTVGDLGEEAISIDPDYTTRHGYDPDFLGNSSRVPLPELTTAMLHHAALNRRATSGPRHVLPYHHFSVIMNGRRRLAYVTAGNIDGRNTWSIQRSGDRWVVDPRIGRDEQTDNRVYADNPLDRGHLVRRLDPAWGGSEQIAKVANDDTFHFTNSSPQHRNFNQNQTTWAGLENHVLNSADNHDLKVTVFTGPVFDDDNDRPYRGIQLPLQFWKVVVMRKQSGQLSATAYLLSQGHLLDDLEPEARRRALEEFQYGQYRTFQVPLRRIERLTGLDFGQLHIFDPIGAGERTGRREISRLDQIRL